MAHVRLHHWFVRACCGQGWRCVGKMGSGGVLREICVAWGFCGRIVAGGQTPWRGGGRNTYRDCFFIPRLPIFFVLNDHHREIDIYIYIYMGWTND